MYLVLVTLRDGTQDIQLLRRSTARQAKSFARMQYPQVGVRCVTILDKWPS